MVDFWIAFNAYAPTNLPRRKALGFEAKDEEVHKMIVEVDEDGKSVKIKYRNTC